MALTGWFAKALVTVPASVVPDTVLDFEQVLTHENLPSDLFLSSGGMKTDAGDVRFAADVSGDTVYDHQIIFIDKPNGKVGFRVKTPSISAVTGATLYIFWNNPNASEVAGSKQAALSRYYGVFDFDGLEALGSGEWKAVQDATGQYTGMTPNGSPDADTGHIDGATAARLSSSFGFDLVETLNMLDAGSFEMQFWSNFEGVYDTGAFMLGQNNIPVAWATAGLQVGYSATATQQPGQGQGGLTQEPASGWQFHAFTIDSNVEFWRQDQDDPGFGAATSPLDNMANIGGNSECPTFLISSVKIIRDNQTSDAVKRVIYANESNISAWASSGPPQTVSQTTSIEVTVVDLQNKLPVPGARVRVVSNDDNTVLLSGVADSSGFISAAYAGATPLAVSGVVRKASLPGTRYKQGAIAGTITSSGFALTVQLISDE